MERPFHDLLPEERAFVLRHLSGQDEYEAMRATLNAMRHLDNERVPIAADAVVRENVMAAFRAQQQPQWRIWLNSVGALFVPKEGHGMWMPSLRIAGIAAVVGVGIWSITRFNGIAPADMVAELKQEQEPSPAKSVAADEKAAVSTATDTDAAIGDPQAPEGGFVIENEASGSGADPGIEGLVAADEMKSIDVAEAVSPASGADHIFKATVTSEEAHEDVSTVFFDARSATDSIAVFEQFAEAAPAREAAVQEVMVVTEAAATRGERKRAEAATKSKGEMELEKDNNSSMANSRALDQRLLSLQNAAW